MMREEHARRMIGSALLVCARGPLEGVGSATALNFNQVGTLTYSGWSFVWPEGLSVEEMTRFLEFMRAHREWIKGIIGARCALGRLYAVGDLPGVVMMAEPVHCG